MHFAASHTRGTQTEVGEGPLRFPGWVVSEGDPVDHPVGLVAEEGVGVVGGVSGA